MIRLVAVALVLALAQAALAHDCIPTTNPEVDFLGFYVDNDLCQPECVASVWVYQESNGIDGLQRLDAIVDDTCGGKIRADTLLVPGHA